MNLLRQLEQFWIAGAVVEPVDAEEIVATAHLLPVMREHLVVRNGQLVFEILRHQVQHARVVGVFVIRLEAEQHDHVRPVIARAVVGETLVRTEIAVGALAGDCAFDPRANLRQHLRVVENVSQFDVALEPVGQFFPAVLSLAVLVEPGVVLLLQPRADLAEMSGQAFALAA